MIDIQSLDPCRALTAAEIGERKFAVAKRSDDSPSLPGCVYQELGNDSYLVQFLKYTSADRLLPGAPNQRGTEGLRNPTISEIDGFGAVEARLVRGAPADCAITVDTGPTSSIQFVFNTLSNSDSPADLEAGCDKARAFAHVGLQNLAPR